MHVEYTGSLPGRDRAGMDAHLCTVAMDNASRVYHRVVSMVYMMIERLTVSRLILAQRVLVYSAIFQGSTTFCKEIAPG